MSKKLERIMFPSQRIFTVSLRAAAGKTGGSRHRFVHDTAPTIALHKPHPGNIVKMVRHQGCVAGADRGGSDMSTMLEYKGYLGSVEYSDADEVLHGRLEFIRDLVTYEGMDARSLKAAFHEAVDYYLALCEAGAASLNCFKTLFGVKITRHPAFVVPNSALQTSAPPLQFSDSALQNSDSALRTATRALRSSILAFLFP